MPVFGIAGVGWKGKQDACLAVLCWEGLFEGIEVFPGKGDGVEELVFLLCANELDVLLEAELELEIALWETGVSECRTKDID